MTHNDAIKRFVQVTLGCGCPEEVFNTIEIINGVEKPSIAELVICKRLFIRFIRSSSLSKPDVQLIQHFEDGIATRNEEGYNRFRLVICSESTERDSILYRNIISRLENIDEKAHIHIVDIKNIPQLLAHL